jgi:CheY-like chemotaxis protein
MLAVVNEPRDALHSRRPAGQATMPSASVRRRFARICLPTQPPGAAIPHGILLVDDQPEFLELAQAALAVQPDVTVIGTATGGEEGIRLAAALAPDVVVLDVQMPGLSGFDTARRMVAASPGLRIVLVSDDGEPGYAECARAAGAEAFLTKKQLLGDGLAGLLTA